MSGTPTPFPVKDLKDMFSSKTWRARAKILRRRQRESKKIDALFYRLVQNELTQDERGNFWREPRWRKCNHYIILQVSNLKSGTGYEHELWIVDAESERIICRKEFDDIETWHARIDPQENLRLRVCHSLRRSEMDFSFWLLPARSTTFVKYHPETLGA